MNKGGIVDLPLLRTLGNLQKVPEATFLESDGLFCFSIICKFGSFKNTFAMITSLSELYFRFRRFILLLQMKKVISMNYGDEGRLTSYLRWGIYTSIPTRTYSQTSLAAAEALSLEIASHWTSQIITKTIPISTRKVVDYVMKWGILFSVYWKVNGNWDNNMIKASQWRKSHWRTDTSATRNK